MKKLFSPGVARLMEIFGFKETYFSRKKLVEQGLYWMLIYCIQSFYWGFQINLQTSVIVLYLDTRIFWAGLKSRLNDTTDLLLSCVQYYHRLCVLVDCRSYGHSYNDNTHCFVDSRFEASSLACRQPPEATILAVWRSDGWIWQRSQDIIIRKPVTQMMCHVKPTLSHHELIISTFTATLSPYLFVHINSTI